MRDYAKTGGSPGRPGYRIPKFFRDKKEKEILRKKSEVEKQEFWKRQIKYTA